MTHALLTLLARWKVATAHPIHEPIHVRTIHPNGQRTERTIPTPALLRRKLR